MERIGRGCGWCSTTLTYRYWVAILDKPWPGDLDPARVPFRQRTIYASRQRQARQVLQAALDQAVTDGLIGRNPTDKVKVAATRRREHRYLTATGCRARRSL